MLKINDEDAQKVFEVLAERYDTTPEEIACAITEAINEVWEQKGDSYGENFEERTVEEVERNINEVIGMLRLAQMSVEDTIAFLAYLLDEQDD